MPLDTEGRTSRASPEPCADALPWGASWDGRGVSFAVRSRDATAIHLCLYDDRGAALAEQPMRREGERWTLYLGGLAPGQRYAYRADGPWEPAAGLRFDPRHPLVDPWALAVDGEVGWHEHPADVDGPVAASAGAASTDDAPTVPHAVVVDRAFDWRHEAPRRPWTETVIYEAHLRGLTRRHPEVPEPLRGTYLGLAQPAVLEHLRSLGVTAIELMPVQHFATERRLAASGRRNYWGYNPLAFFAPHAGYASGSGGEQVREFKRMVDLVHAADMEVILDVVFNHTAEGDSAGPTLSLRGLDNSIYYRLAPEDRSRYLNFSGCGNTLDFSRSPVVDLVLDCLRYWVREMRVDGFRFDLATILGRDPLAFTPEARFFARLAADPDLAGVKLVAEPWDLGPEGYALGRFPAGWAEWNDRYRNAVRRFWRGETAAAGELVRRSAGSPDLFPEPRGARASVNYVTCHDGFTLHDLVSYEHKHNQANGEDDRDGTSHNLSDNCGEEGPSDSPEVLGRRRRRRHNLVATLALSRGVPMLAHGDELGRTQGGNNNAYCQDSGISWVDWDLEERQRRLLAFVRSAFALRRQVSPAHLVLDSCRRPDGGEVAVEELDGDEASCFGVLYRGAEGHRGPPRVLMIVNNGERETSFVLPPAGGGWKVRLDTGSSEPFEPRALAGEIVVGAASFLCLTSAR